MDNVDNNLALIKKGETFIQERNWQLMVNSKTHEGKKKIREKLNEFGLNNISYLPHLIIKKDDISFIVMLFWKEQFPYTKDKMQYTGIDWYKYQSLKEIEEKTHTMIGLIMYSSTDNKMIFRQLNQLSKPFCWFRDYCLIKENKLNKPLDCINCSKQYPDFYYQCVNKKKGKVMAIWNIEEFGTNLIIQRKLLW